MAEYAFDELPIKGHLDFPDEEKSSFGLVNHFNKVFWSHDERIDEITEFLLDEYQESHKIRTKQQAQQYFDVLKVIVCNLVVARKTGKDYISVQLGTKNFVCTITKYEPVRITRTLFRKLLDWLSQKHLNLYRAPNNPRHGLSSVLELTPTMKEWIDGYEFKLDGWVDNGELKFTNEIHIHDAYRFVQKKRGDELVDYVDTEESLHREDILTRYNRRLSNTVITIDGKYINKPVALRSTYRGDNESYGRINGGEWMFCNGELRRTIQINYEDTVEIDIANSTIRLAADISGSGFPHDVDVYQIDGIGREVVKQASTIMQNVEGSSVNDGLNKVTSALFTQYKDKASKAISEQDLMEGGDGKMASHARQIINQNQNNKEVLAKYGIPYTRRELREMVQRVYEYHSRYAGDWLLTGKGLQLQFLESQVTFKVIEKFLELGEVVLTIHDSYIAIINNKLLLENTIKDAYRSVTGCLPVLKSK